MKTVVEFPDQRLLAEEAAEWLIRLDADTPPTQADVKALGEWLQRSPAHREELQNLAALWGRMNVLTELAVPLGKSCAAASSGRRERSGTLGRSWLTQGLIAASVAASVIAAFAITIVLIHQAATDPLLTTNGLYATAVGQQQTTTLADGSEIILNTDTQIKVDYGDQYRDVHLLQGEAHFAVAKSAERPFRVYAGSGRIQAVGTAFSVYLNGEDVDITVTEGEVALASVNPSRTGAASSPQGTGHDLDAPGSGPDLDELLEPLGTLRAGQMATIRGAVAESAAGVIPRLEIPAPLAPDEVTQRLAWREGILTFSGERLEDVVRELGRYTTVSIEIPDAAIRDMRIGGRFPVGETEAMLAALETNFDLRVTHLAPNRVVLSAAND
jgi:transmembrane sensor